ncbi:MAG: SIS domain-containing protein [Chloroflexota bacterium]
MTDRSPMHQQIDTLPDLLREVGQPFDASARSAFNFELCTGVKRIYLVGCGDSYHAPTGAEMAFHQLAGVPTQALNAMTFSRYTAPYLPDTGPNTNLVIAISVSGKVSRTVETLRMARKAGAYTIALTGNPTGPLATSADRVFETAVPPLPDELQGMVVPGVRSYLASQVALYSAAIRIGEVRGHITTVEADAYRDEILALAESIEKTTVACEPIARDLIGQWDNEREFVFVGTGPGYGVAMFSAAKVLEASGDPATAQEVEEWSHLQYFAADVTTPTILISMAGNDAGRAVEVAAAMQAIGRSTVGVLPEGDTQIRPHVNAVMPIIGSVRECFSPIVTSIPGELLAAERAQAKNTPYFRDFAGGRGDQNGPRPSKIYESAIIEELPQ